jgi:DNA-binding transcriptional LysR family regulator
MVRMAAITNGHGHQGATVESVYLKTLVEVVRTGSLSRAAELLCVTQPAVSRRIKFLEDQYGCSLLDRTGPKLRATESGKLVCHKAKALLAIEAELEAGLSRIEGKSRLSFSATAAFGTAHLPAILQSFMATCGDPADLKFTFNTPNEILQGLGEGLLDVAVMEGTALLEPSSLSAFSLPDAEAVFFSTRALGVPSPETTMEALLAFPIYTRREGCCSRLLLERGLKGLGLELDAFKQVVILDDLHLLMLAVQNGEGLGFLPRDLLVSQVASGILQTHEVQGFEHVRKRTLVLNHRHAVSEPAIQLAATILEHFGLPTRELDALPRETEMAPRSTRAACGNTCDR